MIEICPPVALAGLFFDIARKSPVSHAWRMIAESVLDSRLITRKRPGKLGFQHGETLVGNAGVHLIAIFLGLPASLPGFALHDRIANLPDQPLARGQSGHNTTAGPLRVYLLHDLLHSAPRRALPALAGPAHQDAEEVQVVLVRLGTEVGTPPDRVAERDHELDVQRDRISLGMGLDGTHEIAGQAMERHRIDRCRPVRLRYWYVHFALRRTRSHAVYASRVRPDREGCANSIGTTDAGSLPRSRRWPSA